MCFGARLAETIDGSGQRIAAVDMHFATVGVHAVPDHLAIVQGSRRISWAEYDERAPRLAPCSTVAGLGPRQQDGQVRLQLPRLQRG